MLSILIMSAKFTTIGIVEIKVFWNKYYDVLISVDDVTKKNSSRDSNYIVDGVMWSSFGNYSISMGEAIIASIL